MKLVIVSLFIFLLIISGFLTGTIFVLDEQSKRIDKLELQLLQLYSSTQNLADLTLQTVKKFNLEFDNVYKILESKEKKGILYGQEQTKESSVSHQFAVWKK